MSNFKLNFFINFIHSLIYTYEYFSQKKCLNYNVVKNLRKIKFVPNYELPKVNNNKSNNCESPDLIFRYRDQENLNELKKINPFFEFISMKRFLNGEINKEGEIYENMSKYDEQYRLGEIYENISSCDELYILKPKKARHDTKSNLNDFIKDSNYYKYEVRNSNFICLFESDKIQILSLKKEKHQFLYKLHQIIKFNKKFKLLENKGKGCLFGGRYILVCNYIQENDGSKLYFLYENGLIIISKNGSHFQIDSIIRYDNKTFYSLDKYKHKLYILMNIYEHYKNNKVIEINLKNHKIKFYSINIGFYYSDDTPSFAIFDKFMLFTTINTNIIYIYDFNQDKIVNKFEKKYRYIEKLKKENEFIIVCVEEKVSDYKYFSEYWKFENNQFIFLRRKHEFLD